MLILTSHVFLLAEGRCSSDACLPWALLGQIVLAQRLSTLCKMFHPAAGDIPARSAFAAEMKEFGEHRCGIQAAGLIHCCRSV
jgi:hypothetical protein